MEPTEENIRAFDRAHRGPAEGPRGLPEAVRVRLPELRNRHVLHLRCRTGEATRELAELGGFVQGVDPSAPDLAAARANAPTAAFVHAALDELPLELLRGRFHLVYAGRGTLAAVRDLDGFAHGIAGALRPGGFLLLHEDHPVAHRLDGLLRWRGDYFDGQLPRLDALVTAVAQAGLVVRRLEELAPAEAAPARARAPRFPVELVLVAARPRTS